MADEVKGVEIDQVKKRLVKLLEPWLAHLSLAAANDLIAKGVRLEEKQATSDESKRWIPVTERLPEHIKDVLVVACDGYDTFVDIDFLMHDGSWVLEAGERRVTHWMPLPEPPKGE